MKADWKQIRYKDIERTTYIEEKNVMIEEKEYTVPIIKYHIFDGCTGMLHAFSTRYGGVSENFLGSMNLSFTRGDDADKVMLNHKIFAKACGYDYKRLVFSDQIHDMAIYKVTAEDVGKGIMRESDIKGYDALVTNEKNVPLITFYADCIPVYFYDPEKNVIALAHSGWKGTVKKISGNTVAFMEKNYGCSAKDIRCAIGPSICMDCYEVSEDVASMIKLAFDKSIHNRLLSEKSNGKYQLNLQEGVRATLVEAGVAYENIAMPDMCSCCNPDILFSHRASQGKRGNLAAVMMLV